MAQQQRTWDQLHQQQPSQGPQVGYQQQEPLPGSYQQQQPPLGNYQQQQPPLVGYQQQQPLPGSYQQQYQHHSGVFQQPQLPPGWQLAIAPTGKPYFVDYNTGKTHWQLPPVQYQAMNNFVNQSQSGGQYGGRVGVDGGRRKTKMCMNFENGSCAWGDKCAFAHGAHELLAFSNQRQCWNSNNDINSKQQQQQKRQDIDSSLSAEAKRELAAVLDLITLETIKKLRPGNTIRHTRAPTYCVRADGPLFKQLEGIVSSLTHEKEHQTLVTLMSMPRQGKTAFLDAIGYNRHVLAAFGDTDPDLKRTFTFNMTMNVAWGVDRCKASSFQDAQNEISFRIIATAAGLTSPTAAGAATIRQFLKYNNLRVDEIALSVTDRIEKLAGLEDSYCFFLFDEFTNLAKQLDKNEVVQVENETITSKQAVYSAVTSLIGDQSAVVVSGFNAVELKVSGSDRTIRHLMLTPIAATPERREMLVMKTKFFQRVVDTDVAYRGTAIYYYEMCKSSRGVFGALLEQLDGITRVIQRASDFRQSRSPAETYSILSDALSGLPIIGLIERNEAEQCKSGASESPFGAMNNVLEWKSIQHCGAHFARPDDDGSFRRQMEIDCRNAEELRVAQVPHGKLGWHRSNRDAYVVDVRLEPIFYSISYERKGRNLRSFFAVFIHMLLQYSYSFAAVTDLQNNKRLLQELIYRRWIVDASAKDASSSPSSPNSNNSNNNNDDDNDNDNDDSDDNNNNNEDKGKHNSPSPPAASDSASQFVVPCNETVAKFFQERCKRRHFIDADKQAGKISKIHLEHTGDLNGNFFEDAIAVGIAYSFELRESLVKRYQLKQPIVTSMDDFFISSVTTLADGSKRIEALPSFFDVKHETDNVRPRVRWTLPCGSHNEPIKIIDFSGMFPSNKTKSSNRLPFTRRTILRPGRPEWNPVADVVYHEEIESKAQQPQAHSTTAAAASTTTVASPPRLLQVWVDAKHSKNAPIERFDVESKVSDNGTTFAQLVSNGLQDGRLQHDDCVVDHIVHIIVSPYLFAKRKKQDIVAKLKEIITTESLGRLKSYTLYIISPDSVAFQNLVSQPIALSIPLMDQQYDNAWATRLHNTASSCYGFKDTLVRDVGSQLKTFNDVRDWMRFRYDDDCVSTFLNLFKSLEKAKMKIVKYFSNIPLELPFGSILEGLKIRPVRWYGGRYHRWYEISFRSSSSNPTATRPTTTSSTCATTTATTSTSAISSHNLSSAAPSSAAAAASSTSLAMTISVFTNRGAKDGETKVPVNKELAILLCSNIRVGHLLYDDQVWRALFHFQASDSASSDTQLEEAREAALKRWNQTLRGWYFEQRNNAAKNVVDDDLSLVVKERLKQLDYVNQLLSLLSNPDVGTSSSYS